jgi:hypothetical protein
MQTLRVRPQRFVAERQVVEGSYCYTVHGFQKEMEALKKLSPTTHAYLEKIEPHGWARALMNNLSSKPETNQ